MTETQTAPEAQSESPAHPQIHKTLALGKVAYSNPRRKANAVELELRLEWKSADDMARTVNLLPAPAHWALSICGSIWNATHTDCVSCGQNIDKIAKLINTPRTRRIKAIWERWHLNDTQAGTRKQTEAVNAWRAAGNHCDYNLALAHLESLGLAVDRGYKYGSAWLREPLPDNIRAEILQWFEA